MAIQEIKDKVDAATAGHGVMLNLIDGVVFGLFKDLAYRPSTNGVVGEPVTKTELAARTHMDAYQLGVWLTTMQEAGFIDGTRDDNPKYSMNPEQIAVLANENDPPG